MIFSLLWLEKQIRGNIANFFFLKVRPRVFMVLSNITRTGLWRLCITCSISMCDAGYRFPEIISK